MSRKDLYLHLTEIDAVCHDFAGTLLEDMTDGERRLLHPGGVEFVVVDTDRFGRVDSVSSMKLADDEWSAYRYACREQGFDGGTAAWLGQSPEERREYEDGAAGIATN